MYREGAGQVNLSCWGKISRYVQLSKSNIVGVGRNAGLPMTQTKHVVGDQGLDGSTRHTIWR